MAQRSSNSTVTPTALREQADRARFYAHMFETHMLRGDDAVAQRLLAYAAELEAHAAALERKAASRWPLLHFSGAARASNLGGEQQHPDNLTIRSQPASGPGGEGAET
jgi:hypothetical protein